MRTFPPFVFHTSLAQHRFARAACLLPHRSSRRQCGHSTWRYDFKSRLHFRRAVPEPSRRGTFPTLVFGDVADAAFLCMCGKILAAMQLRSRKRPLRGMISRNAEVILFCANRAPKRRQVRRHDLELCTSQKGRTVFFGYENGRITLQPEFTRFMEHVDQRFWRACCDGPSDAARKKCPVGRHIAQ